MTTFNELRSAYHQQICSQILGYKNGYPSNADKSSKISVMVARKILDGLNFTPCPNPPDGQRAGALFESLTRDYLEKTFTLVHHLRPGDWLFSLHGNLTDFDQYQHLADLSTVLGQHPSLRATLGDYLIRPDICIGRHPVQDFQINQKDEIINPEIAQLTPLRKNNTKPPHPPILHASISCKWTIRSDRSQNARTEGLNLIRNRKGNTPHIVFVTAEPLPSRIASVALGTGDIDCIYHFALYELTNGVMETGDETSKEILDLLLNGKRLRDISDLPLDLAI